MADERRPEEAGPAGEPRDTPAEPGATEPDAREPAEGEPGATQPGTPDPHAGPPPAAYIADVVLVAVCAWLLWSDWSEAVAGDVPVQMRTWTFMLNITCVFVILHRGMATLRRMVANPRTQRLLGPVKWGLVIVVPIAVAGQIEREVQLAHKARLDAWVASVDAATRDAMTRKGRVEPGDVASLDTPYLVKLTVRSDTGEYLLEVSVPALDIDGYTGLYASGERRWHIHHNDLEPETAPQFDASGPTFVCRRDSPALACE